MSSTPSPSQPAPARPALIPWYVGSLVLVTGVVAAISEHARIVHSPLTFGLLIALTLALDMVRIDIFERGKTSPATVSAIALACLYGPLGPICAEATILVARLARRDTPTIKGAFDFGLLSLSGAAAAGAANATGLNAPKTPMAAMAMRCRAVFGRTKATGSVIA